MTKKIFFHLLLVGLIFAKEPETVAEFEAEENKQRISETKKAVNKVLRDIKTAACKKDESGVLVYFPTQRASGRMNFSTDELEKHIKLKYGREPNAADEEHEAQIMRNIWKRFFIGLKKEIGKGKSGKLCRMNVKDISVEENRVIVTFKAKDGKSDKWYLMWQIDKPIEENNFIIDQTQDTRNLQKKNFPTLRFATDSIAELNNP